MPELAQTDNHVCNGPEETAALAAAFAHRLQPGDLVLLTGPLGSGKSHFARTLIRGLLKDAGLDVPSPTYNLVLGYGPSADGITVTHADLYRLSGPEEVEELDLDNSLSEGVLVVEWPEIADRKLHSLARRVLDIRFQPPSDTEPETRRRLEIRASDRGLFPSALYGKDGA